VTGRGVYGATRCAVEADWWEDRGWTRGERVLTICTHKQAARAERKGKHRGKQNVRGGGREGGRGGRRVAEEGTLD